MIAGRRKLVDDRRVFSVSRRGPRLSFIALRQEVRQVSLFAEKLELLERKESKRPFKTELNSLYN